MMTSAIAIGVMIAATRVQMDASVIRDDHVEFAREYPVEMAAGARSFITCPGRARH